MDIHHMQHLTACKMESDGRKGHMKNQDAISDFRRPNPYGTAGAKIKAIGVRFKNTICPMLQPLP